MKKLIFITGVLFSLMSCIQAMETNQDLLNRELFELVQTAGATVDDVQKLLDAGAHVNARIDSHDGFKIYMDEGSLEIPGATPLHAAAAHGRTDICKLLIEKGAVIDAKDGTNWTPERYAFHNSHAATCDLFLERGPQKHSALSRIIIIPLLDSMMKKLCSIKYESDETWDAANHRFRCMGEMLREQHQDTSMVTDLYGYAQEGHTDFCAVLLKHGAKVDEGNYVDGTTPLHAAAERDQFDTCILLIRNGADVNAMDYHGRTPLDCAVASGPSCCAVLTRFGGRFTENAFVALDKPELNESMRNQLRARLISAMTQTLFIPQINQDHNPSQLTSTPKTFDSIMEKGKTFLQDPLGPRQNTPFRRIIILLCCMKKVGWPRDIQLLMLSRKALKSDVCKAVLPRLERGLRQNSLCAEMSSVPPILRPELISWVSEHNMQQLEPIIMKAFNMVSAEQIVTLIKDAAFMEKLAPVIYQNMEILLGWHPWISHGIDWN